MGVIKNTYCPQFTKAIFDAQNWIIKKLNQETDAKTFFFDFAC